MRARKPCCCFRVRFERCKVRFITLAVEERLPYERLRICQFLLLILIVLMILGEMVAATKIRSRSKSKSKRGKHIPHCQSGRFVE